VSDGQRVLIIGGAACGPKTASRLKRILPSARITVLEKGPDISYGACGMPYYISGAPRRLEALSETPHGAKRTPGFFARVKGVEFQTGQEVVAIDRAGQTVQVRDVASGDTADLAYDKLVLATGGRPIRPPIPGIDARGVRHLHDLQDAGRLAALLEEGEEPGSAVIVGAGLIGIEMAEALKKRGLTVTLIEREDWIMPGLLDEELAAPAAKHLAAKGVQLVLGAAVEGFETDEENRLTAVRAGGTSYPAELAVVAIGVEPADTLAREAGLEVAERGGIVVDQFGVTSDPDIYAGGDCVISRCANPALGDAVYAPQGSTANKQGRIIANHIAGLTEPFPGVLGTVICRAFDFTVARTGLSETQARAKGLDVETAIIAGPDKPHYMTRVAAILVKLVVDRTDRRLLWCQIVGPGDAAKRLDVVVTALSLGATLDQLAYLDLGYAPPFSPPIDPLLTAAHVLQNKLEGFARGITSCEARARLEGGEVLALDVRTDDECFEAGLPYEVEEIPLDELRERAGELPTDREILVVCKLGLRGYEAQRILRDLGFEKVSFIEGGMHGWPYEIRIGD